MAGKQAKILRDDHVAALLAFGNQTRYPIRNRVLILLSVKAGLRAKEIANISWEMVLDPSDGIASAIELQDWAAKKKGGRVIPLHKDLRLALSRLRCRSLGSGPIIAAMSSGQRSRPTKGPQTSHLSRLTDEPTAPS
jgi:integrase/recombinase XerD